MERTQGSLRCLGVDSVVVGNCRPSAPVGAVRDRKTAEHRDRAGRLTLERVRVRFQRRPACAGARGPHAAARRQLTSVRAMPVFVSLRAVRNDDRSAALMLPQRLLPRYRGSPRRRSLRTVALLPHRVRRHGHQDQDAENEAAHGNPQYVCCRLATFSKHTRTAIAAHVIEIVPVAGTSHDGKLRASERRRAYAPCRRPDGARRHPDTTLSRECRV